MKATQSTTYRTLTSNINNINSKLETLRSQASSGSKLLRPSDDPAAIRPVLSARTQILANDRFISSLEVAGDRLANQDTYLDQAENLLVSAKETALNAINGSLSQADLDTLADKIGYIKDEMLSVANAQVSGQYIFAGYQEDSPPFVADGDSVTYQGDSNIKQLETAPGEYVQTNLSGADLFMGLSDSDGDGVIEQTGENIFDMLTNLERAIRGESGHVYNGNNSLPSADIGYSANGDYTPIALDSTGEPLLDSSDSEIPLTIEVASVDVDGESIIVTMPINLTAATKVDGSVQTIGDYNDLNETIMMAYDGITPADTSQPVYLLNDGSVALVDSDGFPVLLDVDGNTVPLIRDDGPVQLTTVPTLDDLLTTLESSADQTRSARGLMGNNAARIETATANLESISVDLQQILSRYQDVDLIDIFTQITETETALQAALSVTGKVSQLSIMDYL
jgi:flagellar hook-associated protein 3 FlgL